MSMNTKRRHGRIRSAGISTQVVSGGVARPNLQVENLSSGGAFVRTLDLLPVGTKLSLELGGPGLKRPLRLPARVASLVKRDEASARRLPPGMGVAFEPLSDQAKAELAVLLDQLAPGRAVLDGDHVAPEFINQPFRGGPPSAPTRQRNRTLEAFPALGSRRAPPPEDDAPVVQGTMEPIIQATASRSFAETRLIQELAAALTELGAAEDKVKALTAENQKLKGELQLVRRALLQLRTQR